MGWHKIRKIKEIWGKREREREKVPGRDEQREWLLSLQQRVPSRKALKQRVLMLTSTTKRVFSFP